MTLAYTLIDLDGPCKLTSLQELKQILVVPLPVGCSLLVRGTLL